MAGAARTLEVLAIAGSLRRESWNHRLLAGAAGLAPSTPGSRTAMLAAFARWIG